MRKMLAVLALLATLGLTIPAHAANPECRFGTGHKAMRRTIWCVTNKLGTGGAFRRTALYVAARESGFYAGAVNGSSGAAGIYQHLPSYWPGRYVAYSPRRFAPMPASVFNGRTNIIVSMLMARRGGWGPWSM